MTDAEKRSSFRDSHRLWHPDNRLRLESIQRASKLRPCCSDVALPVIALSGIVDVERPSGVTTYVKKAIRNIQ